MEKQFSLYNLAGNKPGEKKSIEEYEGLCQDKKPGGTKYSVLLRNGKTVAVDSRQEATVIKKLDHHKSFKELNTQCLGIPYKYNGRRYRYFPDLVLYTNTNKIMIIEVKMISEMQTRQNLKKFNALRKFCEKHGYLYAMVDKKLKSFVNLKDYHAGLKTTDAIDTALAQKGYFDYHDFLKLIEGEDRKKIKKIRDYIGIYVKQHEDTVKQVNGLTFSSKSFRIKKKN